MKTLITQTIGAGLNTLAYIAPARAADIGFQLFCQPFRSKITPRQKEFFSTAVLDKFTHAGAEIQTYRWGNGPKKILMLHGWQSHTYRWKPYIETLSKDYTVYSLDAPGHGLSGGKLLNVPLYSEVVEQQIMRMEGADAVITHSLGAFTALYTIYRNPGLHSGKLVALASPGEAQEFFEFYKKALRLSQRCSRLVIDKFQQIFQKTPEDFSAPTFAASINIPGLIIHDEDDDETPFHHAERIHAAWKQSSLIKTKGYGHNLKNHKVVSEVVRYVAEPVLSHNR